MMPRGIMMSAVLDAGDQNAADWDRTPATMAVRLSRGAWYPARHLTYVADRLVKLAHEPIRLIVTMPPRHGKSELISHWTPIWFLKRFPHKRVIVTSYQTGYATEWGGMAKRTLEENAEILRLSLTQDTKAKAHWRIKGFGGGMTAVGIGGALTGRGGDLIIIDDPIKSQKEALSETYRNSTWEWYRATLRTRVQKGGSIIVLMTRWHKDDLAGRLIESQREESAYGDRWEVINLPALAEENDPLGRRPGEALWPQMFDEASLLSTKQELGSSWWQAEYQGSPIVQGGNIIKEEWFGYFDPEALTLPTYQRKRCIQVWDTAYGQGSGNSRTACLTLYESEYLDVVDVWAGRPTFPELTAAIKAKYAQYLPERVFVEAKASGVSAIQQLRADTTIPLIQIVDNDDKATRLHSVSGITESGKVRLMRGAAWVPEFLNEVCSFPAAQHDDITDVFSHALRITRPAQKPQAKVVVYDAMPLIGNIDI